MSCKFINPHTENELELSKQLLEYYKLDLYEELDSNMSNFFDSKVSYFFSDSFKEAFGDWTETQYPEDDRIDFEGAPKLFQDGNNLYVLDKNNEKMYINNVRFEGLNAFNTFKGYITELKNDAKVMITQYIFNKYKNTEDDITDFSNLKFNLRDEINAFFDDQIAKRPDNEAVYDVLKDFNDDFENEVIEFLNSVNLSYNESHDEDDSSYQDNLQDNGAVIGKSSVERNSKDNATANVKLMMSLIPDVENTSRFFVGDSMIPFDKVWNDVQSVLSDIPKLLTSDGKPIDPFNVMLDRLNKMSSSKPYLKELIKSLESSNNNLKTQFFQAFGNLGKNVQDTLEVDLNDFNLKTINAAESSSKKSKILTQSGLDFKNNFTTYDVTTQSYSFDLVTYSNFRQSYIQLYGITDSSETTEHGKKLTLFESLKNINLKIDKLVNSSQIPSNDLLVKRQKLMTEANELFHNIVSQLGFNLSPTSFDYFLAENGKYDEPSFDSAITRLGEFMAGFGYIDKYIITSPTASAETQIKTATSALFEKNGKGKYLNPFKGEGSSTTGQKVISDIAEAIANFETDMSEAMVQSGDKQVWAYSQTTHLFDTINILNNSPEEVIKRLDQPFNRHSIYLNQIKNGNKIKLHRTNSMMEKDKASNSVDNINTSKIDAIVRDVFEGLLGKKVNGKSLFPTAVPADKGTALKLETDYFLNTNIRIENGNIIVSDEVLDVFKGYFNDELSTALAAKKFINDQIDNAGNVDTSNLIQYKHVDAKGNTFDILNASGKSIFDKGQNKDINRNNINDVQAFVEENKNNGYRMIYAGNVFKNYMTPSMSPENIINNPEMFSLFYESDFTPINIDVKYSENNKTTLTPSQHAHLNNHLTKILNGVIKNHQDQLIKAGLFTEQGGRNKFDKEIYYEYYTPGDNISNIMSQIAADYTINSIIAQIEFSKVFNGQINSHKNAVDYFKRVPKTYIDGKGLRLGQSENDHISHVAVLQDMEVSSPYIDQMGDVGKKFYGHDRINQADAQAYITPERWKFLLERLGQFGTTEQTIYNKIVDMENGKNVEFTTKELKHLSTKPLKGVYFSNIDNNPLYLKYSQTVLLKSLVKGSPLEKLLNQMRTQSIDEAIMASGVKVGAQFAIDNVSEAILTNKDKFTLKSIPIDNRFWKLQQDLPNKGFKETLLGSQIQKNIFDNFTFGEEKTYTFNDKSYSGNEVYNNIHSVIGELSNRGLEKFKSKFDIQEDYTINNWGKFAKDVAQQLREEKIDENIIQAVEKELTPYVIPQARDKVLSTIMSMVNKSTIKLKTNGGSLIQMSNFGLDQNLADETGIIWIKDKQQLAEPRKIVNENGTPKVLPGQVFISGNLLGQYIPNWKDYSVDELFGADRQGGMFPKEILQLVGYRIPNQAMSSNDALDVVGILPDTYIDTIVAYTGITTKTGSDFDIDKMFMMMPSMKSIYTGNIKLLNTFYKDKSVYGTMTILRDLLEEYGFSNNLTDDEIMSLMEDENTTDKYKLEQLKYLKNKVVESIFKDPKLAKEFRKFHKDDIKIEKVIYADYNNEEDITKQSNDQLNNRLFEMYHSILIHPDNYDNLITPIDHEHIKNFITKDLFPTSNKITDYKAFSPLYQIDMKYEFIAGGFGIGQVANQLVDSISNQNAQETLNHYIGWGNFETYTEKGKTKKRTVFDKKSNKGFYDESGTYKISDTLTALLNGFVDIAKDPYITRGNWNTQTTNTGAFLIRAGVHPYKVSAFLAQPSLVEMVNKTAEKEGITSKDKTSGLVLPELKEFYLDKLKQSLGYNKSDWDALLSEIDSKKSVNLVSGILSNNKITNRSIEELKVNVTLKPGEETPQYYLDQYLALVEYDNLKPTVKEFTKSVGASKYGESGIGKNLIDYLIQANKTADVINKNSIQGFIKKFYNPEQIDKGYTSLGSYHKNTETFFKGFTEANPKIFLTANSYFSNIMNDMSAEIHKNKKYLDDDQLGKIFEQAMYTMVTSQSRILKVDNKELRFLFNKGTEDFISLTDQVVSMREQYRLNKNPNFLLENIEIKEDGDFSFLGVDSIKIKPNGFKQKMTDAWRDLELDNPDLSDNLVKLAYNQSGFRYNGNQMYEFIPHEIFVRNRINNYIDRISNDIISGRINPQIIEDNIYRHNWDNTKIVPEVSDKNMSKIYPYDSGFRLKYDSNRHSGKGEVYGSEILTYPKFVLKNGNLYKLEGYTSLIIQSKEYFEPIYFITHKLGYKSKQGQFHEYNMYKERISSSIMSNNINEEQQTVHNILRGHESWNTVILESEIIPEEKFSNIIENFEPTVEIEGSDKIMVEDTTEDVVLENEIVDKPKSRTELLKTLFKISAMSDIIVKGSVVNYNSKQWIVWNISDTNRAQLIDTEGNKFSGTPNIDKMTKIGDYTTTDFNGTDYIVTAKENIYSLTTGKQVFTSLDNSTKTQKERIISQIMKENDLIEDIISEEDLGLDTTSTQDDTKC